MHRYILWRGREILDKIKLFAEELQNKLFCKTNKGLPRKIYHPPPPPRTKMMVRSTAYAYRMSTQNMRSRRNVVLFFFFEVDATLTIRNAQFRSAQSIRLAVYTHALKWLFLCGKFKMKLWTITACFLFLSLPVGK